MNSNGSGRLIRRAAVMWLVCLSLGMCLRMNRDMRGLWRDIVGCAVALTCMVTELAWCLACPAGIILP